MKKVVAINKLIAAFIFPMFLVGALFAQKAPSQPKEDWTWYRFLDANAIQVVFNNIELDTAKDEKLMALITYDGNIPPFFGHDFHRRSARIMAWFKYCRDDEHITINYFAVPKYEKFSDLPHHISYEERLKQFSSKTTRLSLPRGQVDFGNLLKGVVQNEKIINILTGEEPKQLQVPLPQRLRDDALFDSMRDVGLVRGVRETIKGGLDFYSYVSTGDGDQYYWGFKSHDTAFIRHDDNYSWPIYDYIRDTIDPIKHAIQARETPEEWVEAAYGPRGVMRVFGRAIPIPMPRQTGDPARWRDVLPKKKKY